MHSLALRILRSTAVLATLYPSDPLVLDDWERTNVYDLELARTLGCTPGRAAEVRLAHDAQWQTLNPRQSPKLPLPMPRGWVLMHFIRRDVISTAASPRRGDSRVRPPNTTGRDPT
jgi:hypothetical protein